MPQPFLSSEEFDERAHQFYNEGRYDEALAMLREGLALYPNAVELHIGVGYARLARDEFAWARQSFEEALILDPEHEDALAGLGETLLKFGLQAQAVKAFYRTLELGYQDDIDLMLQCGRALFRDGLLDDAQTFIDVVIQQLPEHAEAVALLGYIQHRRGEDEAAVKSLRRALRLDEEFSEARIYLGNLLYDRSEYEAALYHLDRTVPEDHWDELAIWRLIELKKSVHRVEDADPQLRPWVDRIGELQGESDALDELLGDIEQRANDDAEREAQQQLELFAHLLGSLAGAPSAQEHSVVTNDGRRYEGTWEEVVLQLQRHSTATPTRTMHEFMQQEARRGFALTGILIPTGDAESFIRGSADAGLLRLLD
ncbi:MAG: tetratricopeptide repeat protein [Gemmatimonadaceae bacterium]|nr:tetratricopeptide repeat protein [Gemmatimonadaceae bacterium]